MTVRGVNLGAAAILFPALVAFTLLGVTVAAFQGAWEEIEHWLPEFATTWRFVTRGGEG